MCDMPCYHRFLGSGAPAETCMCRSLVSSWLLFVERPKQHQLDVLYSWQGEALFQCIVQTYNACVQIVQACVPKTSPLCHLFRSLAVLGCNLRDVVSSRAHTCLLVIQIHDVVSIHVLLAGFWEVHARTCQSLHAWRLGHERESAIDFYSFRAQSSTNTRHTLAGGTRDIGQREDGQDSRPLN